MLLSVHFCLPFSPDKHNISHPNITHNAAISVTSDHVGKQVSEFFVFLSSFTLSFKKWKKIWNQFVDKRKYVFLLCSS